MALGKLHAFSGSQLPTCKLEISLGGFEARKLSEGCAKEGSRPPGPVCCLPCRRFLRWVLAEPRALSSRAEASSQWSALYLLGLVHVGDELREVNGITVLHKRPDEISQILVRAECMPGSSQSRALPGAGADCGSGSLFSGGDCRQCGLTVYLGCVVGTGQVACPAHQASLRTSLQHSHPPPTLWETPSKGPPLQRAEEYGMRGCSGRAGSKGFGVSQY